MNIRYLTFGLMVFACAAGVPTAWTAPDDNKIIRIPGTRRVIVLTTEETLAQATYPGYLAMSGPPAVKLYHQPPTPRPRRVSDPAHMTADRQKEAQKEKEKIAAVQAEADKTAATAPVIAAEPTSAAPTDAAAVAATPTTSPAPDVLPTQQATDPHDRTEELLSYFQRQKQAAAVHASGTSPDGYPGPINGELEPSFLQPPPSTLAPLPPAPPSRATYHVTE